MAITLNLAPEDEAQVRQKAQAQGREAESYVAELVLRDINSRGDVLKQPGDEQAAPSLAESLQGLIGVLSSAEKNSGRLSHIAENTGVEFTKSLVEKHRVGHL